MANNNQTGASALVVFSDTSGSVDAKSFQGDTMWGGNTIWYVDDKAKAMYPFLSYKAFADFYGDSFASAVSSVQTMDSTALQQGGRYAGYIPMDKKYGIDNGKVWNKPQVTPATIASNYGQAVNDQTTTLATSAIDGFVSLLEKEAKNLGITNGIIEDIKNDPLILAGYISAIGYGGYSFQDILGDVTARSLSSEGKLNYSDAAPISFSSKKSDYLSTNEGRRASSLLAGKIPPQIASWNMSIFSKDIQSLPDEFWEATFPSYFDPKSPEFKKKMEEVETALHDSILQTINAKTDAEKAYADYEWKNTKDALEKKYGITLEDNALAAWDSIQTTLGNYKEAGLSGSGLEAENIAKILSERRRLGDRARDAKSVESLDAMRNYYQKSASSAEIAKLNEEDAAKGLPRDQWRSVQWGLAPLQEVKFDSFLSQFRTNNPNNELTDEEVKELYFDPFYDDNGNFRSSIYATQKKNEFQTRYGYDPEALPGSPEASQKGVQTSTVIGQGIKEIEQSDSWKDESFDPESGITNTTPSGFSTKPFVKMPDVDPKYSGEVVLTKDGVTTNYGNYNANKETIDEMIRSGWQYSFPGLQTSSNSSTQQNSNVQNNQPNMSVIDTSGRFDPNKIYDTSKIPGFDPGSSGTLNYTPIPKNSNLTPTPNYTPLPNYTPMPKNYKVPGVTPQPNTFPSVTPSPSPTPTKTDWRSDLDKFLNNSKKYK